jgi:hypothetical protein
MGLPKKEGISTADVPKISLNAINKKIMSPKATLRELSHDFVIFSTALLHVCGGLDRSPLDEFLEINPDIEVGWVNLGIQFLRTRTTLPPASIDLLSGLWAVERASWDQVKKHLQATSAVDPARNRAWSTILQNAFIPDVLAIEKNLVRGDDKPEAAIQVFTVAANDGIFLVSRDEKPWPAFPVLMKVAPDNRTLEFTRSLLTRGEGREDSSIVTG